MQKPFEIPLQPTRRKKMYKTKSKFLAIILIASLSMSACVFAQDTGIEGSGVVVEETREISGVHSVRLTMDAHLTLTVGDTESLTFKGEDNLFAYVLSDVDGGVITIQSRPRIELDPTEPISFTMTVKQLDLIEVTTTGVAEVIELNADALEVKVSDSGSLTIAGGKVGSQTVTVSGSGNYNGEALESDKVEVKVTSSGKARIWVNDQLTVEIGGSGEVHYKGDPSVDGKSSDSEGLKKIGN
jgi:hypothetical protein